MFIIKGEEYTVETMGPKGLAAVFSYAQYLPEAEQKKSVREVRYTRKFPDALAAEKAARDYCAKTGREVEIFKLDERGCEGDYVATVLRDALDRIWTQVTVEGGAFI